MAIETQGIKNKEKINKNNDNKNNDNKNSDNKNKNKMTWNENELNTLEVCIVQSYTSTLVFFDTRILHLILWTSYSGTWYSGTSYSGITVVEKCGTFKAIMRC